SVVHSRLRLLSFFIPPPPTTTYTLSLHDALPIFMPARPAATARPRRARRSYHRGAAAITGSRRCRRRHSVPSGAAPPDTGRQARDRKSTRLNSSHSQISYAVFCLKKKKKNKHITQ